MRRGFSLTALLRATLAAALTTALVVPFPARAGGPLYVGGPNFGVDGQFLTWDVSTPVPYRIDGGPLSSKPDGTIAIDNATGATRVNSMFLNWENVPTASIRFSNAGAIQNVPPGFTDGDVDTVTELNAVKGDCNAGNQNPIIFDANGALFNLLFGDPRVLGFASICKLDSSTGRIVSAMAVLNGIFQDGISSRNNYELTTAEFDEVFIHEFGHFAGLDHSQINVDVLKGQPNSCSSDDLAGLPLMFPILFCQARSAASLPVLAPDDLAWISHLYPETGSGAGQTPFNAAYGTIRGAVFFSDGISQAQGVNVVARRISDGNALNGDETRRIAFSAVSGYRFTGRPGQSVTTNSPPSKFGSRDSHLIGVYEIPVTPGTYTVQVESVNSGFAFGSSVGPVDPPIPNPGLDEYWNTAESATDSPTASSTVTATAGQTVGNIDIILNGTPKRFDAFESAELWQPDAPPLWLRREKSAQELLAA
ncbi:MAG: hypothetical protein HY234_06880 [Acidobacteria bacterium]|nr:hypothetical protein [Acidobacteriota bacterium]MBI3662757.1 hypothetical protein [Acidobacteriota bacterium]